MNSQSNPSSVSNPRLREVRCLGAGGLHRMAYTEWGDPANPRVLVCVHGLSRQGRDFDVLARAMAAEYRVVCPDVVGRGRSDWLKDPSGYIIPNYVADMVTLLARLDAEELHWVGTSMGGLIGLGLACLPDSPIQRLVLNDVGPKIEWASLVRIGQYLGHPARWSSLDEAADALWAVSRTFGPHTREQWLALTEPMLRQEGDAWRLHYDPAIAVPFKAMTEAMATAGEAGLWYAWSQVRCPTLIVRGAESDLLSEDTARMMTERRPGTRLHVVEGVGHAPMLVQPDQVAVVRDFLLEPAQG